MKPKDGEKYLIRIISTFRKKREFWYNGKANHIYPVRYSERNGFTVLQAWISDTKGLEIGKESWNGIEEKHAEILCKL